MMESPSNKFRLFFEVFYTTLASEKIRAILPSSSIAFTVMLIREDEVGRPYGQYWFKQEDRTGEALAVLSQLEKYRLYLDQKENSQFTITQLYHQPQTTRFNTPPHPPVPLKDYFALSHPSPQTEAEAFIQNEKYMLEHLTQYKGFTNGHYFPIPLSTGGNLHGIVYGVYDEVKSSQNSISEALIANYESIRITFSKVYQMAYKEIYAGHQQDSQSLAGSLI